MINADDRTRLVTACRLAMKAGPQTLPEEYFYSCVPLCIIDAVYSIGVRYEGVRNVIDRYCAAYKIPKNSPGGGLVLPSEDQQQTTSFLMDELQRGGPERFAADVFCNRQRTSTRNGILKAEAVLLFARALVDHGAEYLQGVPQLYTDSTFEQAILDIPGQGSGLSLRYFFMLAGSDDLVKPDRMVIRFLSDALRRDIDSSEAQGLVEIACTDLRGEYPDISPRLLDHCIWAMQRTK